MKLRELVVESTGIATPLYRGMTVPLEKNVGDVIPITVRQDRKPKDASLLASVLFNYGIQKMCGIVDIRKRCSFASTSKVMAMTYARHADKAVVQLLLPGNAKIVFNPQIDDSLDLLANCPGMEGLIRELKKHGYMGMQFDWDKPTSYLSMTALELWQDALNELDVDEPTIRKLNDMFEESAIAVVAGYQVYSPRNLDFRQDSDIECLIFGVTSYEGRVDSESWRRAQAKIEERARSQEDVDPF